MKKRAIFLVVFAFLISLTFVSAKVDIDIQSMTIEEPVDGIINDKDSIHIKVTFGNFGDTDWNSPYYVDFYANGIKHSSCYGSCELSGSPVNQGLEAGQIVEYNWAASATDREFLKLGQNELKFYLGFEGETEYAEKSITFDITEGGLPELDLEISSGQVNLVDVDGEKKIESVEADILNRGPLTLENDVISISFCISSEDGESNLGCYGSFLDLREEFCNPSVRDCTLNSGETTLYLQTENLERLNSKLNPGKYVINYYLDDINGLKNYQDTNPNNNYLYSNFEIAGSSGNQTELVYDEISGIYMEQVVKDKLDSRLYNKMNPCSNCDNLPQPTISLDSGDKSAIYNLYFHGQKIRGFILPFPNVDKEIINNPQNVLVESGWISADGTNSIEFLINSQGNFFQNRYDILTPNQETNINYKIVKKDNTYGSVYFFIQEGDNTMDVNQISQNLDQIAYDNSQLTGMSLVPKYYVLIMPTLFAGLLGGEGNFYMGDGLISINYGGEKNYDLWKNQYDIDLITSTFSHEYTHLLQHEPETNQYAIADNTGFFMEGMADAVSVYNGYRRWEDVLVFENMPEDPMQPGCIQLANQHTAHTFGRCIFKHLDQDGFLNEAFFNRLFHLPGDSYLIYNCEIDLQDTSCTSELNRLLSFSANQDMTSFMKNSLLANLDGVEVQTLTSSKSLTFNSEDSCPLIGLRKDNLYCSPGKMWVNQMEEDAICDNNFECKTNLCIDGNCFSSGMWQKFLNWLQNLFG